MSPSTDRSPLPALSRFESCFKFPVRRATIVPVLGSHDKQNRKDTWDGIFCHAHTVGRGAVMRTWRKWRTKAGNAPRGVASGGTDENMACCPRLISSGPITICIRRPLFDVHRHLDADGDRETFARIDNGAKPDEIDETANFIVREPCCVGHAQLRPVPSPVYAPRARPPQQYRLQT